MTSKTWSAGTVIDSPWLQDVNDLTYGISSTSSPTKGAGYVGYDYSQAYTVRTVGGRLRDLGVFASDIPGYDPTGSAASDTAIATAISVAASRGLYTVFLTGTPKITLPINYTNKLALVGVGAGEFFSNDPTTFPVRILCKGVTGYIFDQPDATDGSGPLVLQNICFDGKNGGGSRSTTLQGIVKASSTSGKSSFFLRMKHCMVGGSDSATAMLKLDGEVFAHIEDTMFRDWPYGYGAQAGAANELATTITFSKCYWNSVRQVAEFTTNQVTDVHFNHCVIESCLVGVANAYGSVTFTGGYSENMGYDASGTALTTGLTARDFGVGDIAGNVSAVFTCRFGQMVFRNYTLQNTTGGKKWFDGIGRASGSNDGGQIKVEDLFLAAGTISTLFTADADVPSSRSGFEYHMSVKRGTAAYLTAADARMLTKGRVPILWTDGIVRPVEVEAGLFTLPPLTVNGITALPTIAPDGGNTAIGDRVRMAPSQYQEGVRTSYMCVVAGSAAASRWQIDDFIPSSKQGSVLNAGTLVLTASAKDNPGEVHVWEVLASTGANIESRYRITMQAFSGAGQLGVESIVTTKTLTFAMGWGDPYTITITNTSGSTLSIYARLISISNAHT